jgi:hypothetical protein
VWRASKVRDDAADCMIAKFEVKSSLKLEFGVWDEKHSKDPTPACPTLDSVGGECVNSPFTALCIVGDTGTILNSIPVAQLPPVSFYR